MNDLHMEKSLHEDIITIDQSLRSRVLLWKSTAILQIPLSLSCLIISMSMFFESDTILEVQSIPQPGFYEIDELPDAIFISYAQNLVNLLMTYQPFVLETQYAYIEKAIDEKGEKDRILRLLDWKQKWSLDHGRSEIFFVTPRLTKVHRFEDSVVVVLVGDDYIYFTEGGKHLRSLPQLMRVELTLGTSDIQNRAGNNLYGIVLKKISIAEI